MSEWDKNKYTSYTEQEKLEYVREVLVNKTSYREMTEKYGMSKTTICAWMKKYGHLAEKDDGHIPLGHAIQGTSTLYKDGKIALEWVKTNQKAEEILQNLEIAANTLSKKIPPQEPIRSPKYTKEDLCSTYIITDYHFGQMSSLAELGEKWDMEIAENLLLNWFGSAIDMAPESDTAILCQLGDFLHTDGLAALTPASKHILDACERYGPIVDVVMSVLRKIINMLLEKHKHVHIVMATGNHDESGSCWLRGHFAQLYSEEPRVTVDRSHIPFYGFEWGKTAVFFHHGHKVKTGGITEVMTAQFPKIIGNTEFRYAHTGHFHHKKTLESRVMVVEQHSTLAAKDAYSAYGGYHSQRSASVITYSKEYGEVSRATISPKMVEN